MSYVLNFNLTQSLSQTPTYLAGVFKKRQREAFRDRLLQCSDVCYYVFYTLYYEFKQSNAT